MVHDERTEQGNGKKPGNLLLSDEDQHNVVEMSISIDPELVFEHLHTPIDQMADDETTIPAHWDWRDINGVDYTSIPPDQGGCGSCYIHATMGMAESRIRVFSEGKLNPQLSVQYIIDCNFHTEGCDGGYEITTALFAYEFDFRNRQCYEGNNQPKGPSQQNLKNSEWNQCERKCENEENFGVESFGIVGGAYGETTELGMMKEIRARGPITIAFEAQGSFMGYREGIFKEDFEEEEGINIESIHHPMAVLAQIHRESITDKNLREQGLEWESVNHAILIVGLGELCHDDGSCTKYWICENSWGQKWAKEGGFFYMLRGDDIVSIESFATYLIPKIPESLLKGEGEQTE